MNAPQANAPLHAPQAKAQNDWKQAFSVVAPPFFLSRIWVALWVYLGQNMRPSIAAPIAGGYAGVENWWLNAWTTYDTEHFFRIARVGYEAHTAPFFPLYPFVLRLFAPNELAMALWGIVVSNVALLIGLAFLFRLTTLDYDQRIAKTAIWLLAFSPICAVLSAVYTDALFFCFLVATFWAARNNRYAVAGICAALAALTRNSGPIIFVALLFHYMSTHVGREGTRRDKNERFEMRDLFFITLPLLAFLIAQIGIAQQLGGALTGITSHEKYGRALMWPFLPIWRDLLLVIKGRGDVLVTFLNLSATIGALVFGVFLWHRRRSYAILLLGIIGMQLVLGRTFAPYTNSSLRFMTTTFPFAQMLALYTQPLTRNRFRLAVCAAIYLLICALVSYDFGMKQFVTG